MKTLAEETNNAERLVYQFEAAHSCAIYTVTDSHAGATAEENRPPVKCPKLYVQSIDAYGFQRELSVGKIHRYDPATGKTRFFWECHAYQHPGRREISEVSEYVATRFIAEFLKFCRSYPSLLFTETQPINRGFVALSERLLRGEKLSASML